MARPAAHAGPDGPDLPGLRLSQERQTLVEKYDLHMVCMPQPLAMVQALQKGNPNLTRPCLQPRAPQATTATDLTCTHTAWPTCNDKSDQAFWVMRANTAQGPTRKRTNT